MRWWHGLLLGICILMILTGFMVNMYTGNQIVAIAIMLVGSISLIISSIIIIRSIKNE